MRKIWLLLPALLCAGNIYASFDPVAAGARSAGLSGFSTTLSDPWSVFNNPAGIGSLNHPVISLSYENRFLMKELGTKFASFIIPTKAGVLGATLKHFGYSLYSESSMGVACAKKFGDHICAGIKLDYFMLSIAEDYGRCHMLSFEGGIITNISNHLSGGIYIANPLKVKISSATHESLPVIIRMGFSYRLSDKSLIGIEVEKSSHLPATIIAAAEIKILSFFFFRAGISSNPRLVSTGIGVVWDQLSVDMAFSMHEILGVSPQLSVNYYLKIKN